MEKLFNVLNIGYITNSSEVKVIFKKKYIFVLEKLLKINCIKSYTFDKNFIHISLRYYNNKPLFEKIEPFISKTNTAYQWRRKYVRENKSGVCPTLTANMGTGGHNVPIIKDDFGIRKLTPRECARLQGFNDNYILPNIADSHLYKQIGNSVSIPVVEQIAYRIKQAL